MSIEERYSQAVESVRNPAEEVARLLQAEAKRREQAMLIRKQEEEIRNLRERLGEPVPAEADLPTEGALEVPGEPGESLEERFSRTRERTDDPFYRAFRLAELDIHIKEQALLLDHQQREIGALWRRLGVETEVPSASGAGEGARAEGERTEEDAQLNVAYGEVKRLIEQGNEAGAIEYLRILKHTWEEEAARAASLDPLTGLPNRRAFTDDAQRLLNIVREPVEYHAYLRDHPGAQRRAKPPREEGDFSVLLLDLDFFKKINDTYGHGAGDEVLKAVSGILMKTVRKNDVVARWGGEEFIVALKSDVPGARVIVAEKIRRAIEQATVIWTDKKTGEGIRIPVTVSIGAAKWHLGEEMTDVIQGADANLYKAKEAGRNRAVIDDVG